MGLRFRKRIKLYNISRQGIRDTFSVPLDRYQLPNRARRRWTAPVAIMKTFEAVCVAGQHPRIRRGHGCHPLGSGAPALVEAYAE